VKSPLFDLLRATIVADDVTQIHTALKLLHWHAPLKPFDERISMCRVKNKFAPKAKVSGGFRSIHVNLLLRRPNWKPTEPGFVCELQIQLRDIWDQEKSSIRPASSGGHDTTSHDRYIKFRNYRAE